MNLSDFYEVCVDCEGFGSDGLIAKKNLFNLVSTGTVYIDDEKNGTCKSKFES
jgi:hypothetical protein